MTLRQLFFENLAQTSDFPLALEIEKAEGLYLYASDSKKYMDLISGIGVSNVGHRHPKVLAAIQQQLDKYLHLMVYGEYVQTPQVLLAAALTKTLPENLDNVYFTNSGTEAIEGVMKIAKRFTRRAEIIACNKSYHGSTQGALSLGDETFKRNFRPLLPDIRKIEHNKIADLEKITQKTAAVIIEPVQGEAGVRVPDKSYLQALRKRCDEVGAMLIFDEIQTGFGRTGTFWAFQDFVVVPDALVCAKGMGGGMPIGAFITSKEKMSVIRDNPILGHITTFGGHPVSCAASLATLNTIFEEDLLAGVYQKGELFKSLLKHPKIKEVRGKGLMLAAEMESFEVLKQVIDKTISKGIITDWFLYCDNAMRIAPPLTITEQEIKIACDVILSCLD